MLHQKTLAALVVLGFTAACSSLDAGPSQPLSASGRHNYLVADAIPVVAESLHVEVGGIGIVRRPGNQTYHVNLSNTTGTRFQYEWLELDCLSNCFTAPFWGLDGGEGLSSIVSGFAATTDYRIFEVHVVELDGQHRSGAGRFEAQGPDIWNQADGGALVGAGCDIYGDLFYPLLDSSTGKYFRRNPCTNAVEWAP